MLILIYCSAQKFRKIEQDKFSELQRVLKMEVMKADNEVRNKKILSKHEEIQANNDNLKKQRQDTKEAILRETLERKAQQEAERAAELKRLQQLDAEYAQQKVNIQYYKLFT